MDASAQLREVRSQRRADFEEDKAARIRRLQPFGVLRPSVSAEALSRQLRNAIVSSTMTAELQSSIFQWALLSRLGAEEWGAPRREEEEDEPIFAFANWLPCFGSMGRGERMALPSSALPDLGPLLRCPEAIEALLLGGGCRDWRQATMQLCRLLLAEPSLLDGGWQLQLAAAYALCIAEGEEMWDTVFAEGSIDMLQRYQSFCTAAACSKWFPEFKALKSWHFRYVLGSWHSDQDLAWSRDHVDQQYKKPDVIGQSARMVKYKLHNDQGVSVHEGLGFYDGNKATMPRILAYGGVCGAVSKFGASCCQAFGVPAMPVGQPGHCAMIWRAPEGRWCLENDNGGWNQSRMHDKIQRTWQKELGPVCENAGVIPVAEQALSECFGPSEALRLAAQLAPRDLQLQLLLDAVGECAFNLCAWADVIPVVRGLDSGALTAPLLQRAERAEANAVAGPWKGGRDLSLNRPVRASAGSDRAKNVVDGTDSEWFPEEAEPQWLDIDLQTLSQVHQVRVKWWGDYGKKSSLKVLSQEASPAAWVERGRRSCDADFNGWTELKGWKEPTRLVRLELDNPCPDCFGLKKSYGIRRVEVLGSHLEGGLSTGASDLLHRLAEASFPRTQELADQQGLHLVQELLTSHGLAK
ncbi:unnamed protein product [Effrenium voratum]|uniref:F5/8 type C domain-containing protein n=1 Tax=Effrenium voratum TaxID=2562239 RepID=A0AA36IVY2_9DINO|nr:unnamed protein product [Effrenium voratum]CAJ1447447.1 unnamed protein product [Effrenium voratum]